jgi:hypothetical protein
VKSLRAPGYPARLSLGRALLTQLKMNDIIRSFKGVAAMPNFLLNFFNFILNFFGYKVVVNGRKQKTLFAFDLSGSTSMFLDKYLLCAKILRLSEESNSPAILFGPGDPKSHWIVECVVGQLPATLRQYSEFSGPTDFNAVAEYARIHGFSKLVIFTDGQAAAPANTSLDITWVNVDSVSGRVGFSHLSQSGTILDLADFPPEPRAV